MAKCVLLYKFLPTEQQMIASKSVDFSSLVVRMARLVFWLTLSRTHPKHTYASRSHCGLIGICKTVQLFVCISCDDFWAKFCHIKPPSPNGNQFLHYSLAKWFHFHTSAGDITGPHTIHHRIASHWRMETVAFLRAERIFMVWILYKAVCTFLGWHWTN